MKAEEDYNELDAYIDTLINEEYVKLLEGDIGLCTCQLFRQDSVNNASPFASGVFVVFEDEFYLLTASHVIEDWSDSNRLFVKIGNAYVSIAGKGCGTEIDKVKKIDAAYIKLKPELISILVQWYRFLPHDKCLFLKKRFEEQNYCVFGYPVINKRKEAEGIRTFASGYFLKAVYDKVYEYYLVDFLTHYVLEFKGRATNIKTGKLEKIKTEHYGLSGSGLWYIVIEFDEDKMELVSEAFLIGIMTEFRRGKYDCLIANRIEIILSMIKENENPN